MAKIESTKAPAKSKAAAPKATAAAREIGTPSRDAVAVRAYELWRASGGAHGNDQAHWFRAEQELRAPATLRP